MRNDWCLGGIEENVKRLARRIFEELGSLSGHFQGKEDTILVLPDRAFHRHGIVMIGSEASPMAS